MSSTLFTTIFVLLGIAIFFVSYYLLNRAEITGKFTFYLALFLGGGFAWFMHASSTMTYVVTGDEHSLEVTKSRSFGSSAYTMSTGEEIDEDVPRGNCIVINDSKASLVVEDVVYGTSSSSYDINIDPFSITILSEMTIDYMPDENPPNSVSVNRSSSGTSKTWLRRGN